MLEWYLRRAAAMSFSEICHRIREHTRRRLDRHDRSGWHRFDMGEGRLDALRPLFAFGRREWSMELVAAVAQCTRLDGPIEFLGQVWPASAQIGLSTDLWHRDPVSGERWPSSDAFCFDVEWRQEKNKGDIKFVLELNRLQMLQPMAAMALRNHDAGLARSAAEIVLSWMEDNPPFRGVNWLSGIELALRLVSVSFVVTALDKTMPNHNFGPSLRSFIAAHAYWLDRFPSLYSSANNHRVAEALGLLIASELIPDLDEAPRYRCSAQQVLDRGIRSQFHSDGTGAEQSPTYAAFTLELILLAILINHSVGHNCSIEVETIVGGAAGNLRSLLDTGGRHPRIGDDDEGRVIGSPPCREDRYVASVVAAAAGVIGRPELAPPARSPHLRDLLFSSPEVAAPISSGVVTFPAGGYSVVREIMGNRSVLLIMDHGPLGFFPLAAHGHADALALWLHIDDQAVFVDAGTYRYNSSGHWREWLRSTHAHNTVSIEGESQSIPAGPFNWKHKGDARLISCDPTRWWQITAEHNAYKKRFAVVHRRTCRRVKEGILIEDSLQPPRDLRAVIGFLICPALKVEQHEDSLLISRDEDALIRLTCPSNSTMTVVTSAGFQTVSVYSNSYNRLVPATRIEFHLNQFSEPHVILMQVLQKASKSSVPKPA